MTNVSFLDYFFFQMRKTRNEYQCLMSHSTDILLKPLIWIVRQWNWCSEYVSIFWHFNIIYWIWTTLVIWLNKHHWNIHIAQFPNGNGNNVLCDNCSPESQVLNTNIHQYIQMVVRNMNGALVIWNPIFIVVRCGHNVNRDFRFSRWIR